MARYDIVFFCAIFAFAAFIVYLLLNYQKPAEVEASPVTTEVSEYKMKCVKFGPYVCEEYTIYRITRN